ncbi:DUF6114 domain-containing protein [Symbioplanes lichenis]|uniref:DUF6114 domain-containing protein n=1 Tax=Symbioplanes lichenis TaxID=1629072 RepID=UPI00273A2885|nr:DUF6114 domain-containing protein [Actinoplanes lichenis]
MAPLITAAGFRHWRRTRPFWGGLLLLLAGLEMFLSANQSLGDLEVHFGPQGFLSYLLPALLLLCGILTWVSPGQRLFYGIIGLLTAVYSLVGLNFGGFVLGLLLGITGGALVLAWSPPRRVSPAPPSTAPSPAPDDTVPLSPATPSVPAAELPYGAPPDPDTGIVPGFRDNDTQSFPPAPDDPGPRGDVTRKALVITLVPLVAGGLVVAGGRVPARAAECPEGLPSRSTTAKTTQPSPPPSTKPSPSAKKPSPKPSASRSAPASASPTPSKTTSDDPGDPLGNIVGGIGDLLDPLLPDPPSQSPSSSASPSRSPSPSSSPTATPSATRPPTSASPSPSRSAQRSPSATPSPSAGDDIPCLGPRVHKKAAPGDVPQVSLRGGTLETASLTMYNSTYVGVADLPTAEGILKALRFDMDKAVNKPFTLTIPEAGGRTTLIESNELTTDGHVRFYTPKFQGKLFGLIPVTFTPDQPPPLTLPVLWFTDVTINLAFVRCDTLTADPLELSGKA